MAWQNLLAITTSGMEVDYLLIGIYFRACLKDLLRSVGIVDDVDMFPQHLHVNYG